MSIAKRKHLLVGFVTCIIILAVWIYIGQKKLDESESIPIRVSSIDRILKGLKEEILSCKIPQLNPFNADVVKHYGKVLPINCSSSRVFFEADFLSKPPSIQQIGELEGWGPCCYKRIEYEREYKYNRVENVVQKCLPLLTKQTQIPLDSEYVHIFCNPTPRIANITVHEEILNFAPVKERSGPVFDENKSRSKSPSVLVVRFDHQSRADFLRQMPQTYNYIMNELGAIEMLNFNKIGDAAFNNSDAFLMGLNYSEVRNSCWKNGYSDSCPWIWKDFARNGYTTSLSDDIESDYTYNFKGFKSHLTDYYFQPFISRFPTPNMPTMIASSCLEAKSRLRLLHDNIKKTAWTLRNKPYFHIVWQSGIHKKASLSSLTDSSFKETLSFLRTKNFSNSTILLLISDHGCRYGNSLHEYQGRLENRLPFTYFIFPEWFKGEYSYAVTNMKANTKRLTTPYDIHETLKDLANVSKILSKKQLSERFKEPLNNRGISLFLPVPRNRTCKSAGIEDHWCKCDFDKFKLWAVNSSLARHVGEFAVKHLNSLLIKFPLCSQLKLRQIIIFEAIVHRLLRKRKFIAFRIILSLSPGKGKFEAIVLQDATGILTMPEEISRLTPHEIQSYCINTTI